MLGTKELDLLNRSEIGHHLYMSLWELSNMKGSHNDHFVVRKKYIEQYLIDLEEDYKKPGSESYIEETRATKEILEKIVSEMKTNNLYIQ